MTDVGTGKRGRMTPTRRLKVFERAKGTCWVCFRRIQIGEKWIVEHLRPLGLGGTDDDENLGVTHLTCAQEKTKGDMQAISKAKRSKIKAYGMKSPAKNPMPGSKASKWKRRMDGTVVPRYGVPDAED